MSTPAAVPGRRTVRVTTLAAVLALVAGLLVVLQTVAAPVARAAGYPAVDGTRSSTTDPVGAVGTGPSVAGSTCASPFSGAITLLTALLVSTGGGDRVTDLGLGCAIPAGAPVDPATAPAPSVRPFKGETADPNATPTACPTDQAVVGLQGRLVSGEIGAAGDVLADLRLFCSPLGSDGAPYASVAQPWVTGSGDGTPSDVVRCPTGEAAYQLGGYADTGYVYGLRLTCTAPVYDPAVLAASFPQTDPSLQPTTLGDVTGSDHIPAACGNGVVATGVRLGSVGTEGGGSQISTTGVTCTPLSSPSAPATLDPSRAVPVVDPPGGEAPDTADCPAGTVLTGLVGYPQFDGSAELLGGLAGSCSQLDADGTTSYVDGEPVSTGPVGDTSHGPDGVVYCPADQIVTGLAIAYTDIGYGPTPRGLEVACSRLTLEVSPEATNSSWTTATTLAPNQTVEQALTSTGAALWFKVPVQPSSTVRVDLDQLPADDDLAVFTDIGQAFTALQDTGDLARLSAEFAGVDVAPTTFSPTTFSPTTFSPTTFSPTTFSPTTFSPTTFSPTTFSPTTFSPTTFSPTTFSPAVTPDQYVTAGKFADLGALANAFSAAQTRSLIAVSANSGLTPESWSGDTYNRSGYYYVRVTGRDGVTSSSPFRLQVTTTGGPCDVPLNPFTDSTTLAGSPGAGTVVLTDTGRFAGASAADLDALRAANASFVAAAAPRGPLAGVGPVAVVDLADSPKVQQLQAQADAHPGCPYAKTLVAQAARDVVNSYRGGGSAPGYVVVEGGDAVVPFFRYTDAADVAPESGFQPPVATSSASDASLRNDFVLGQDAYGAAYDLTIGGLDMPVPDAAVGRLVESAPEVTAALTAYVAGGGASIDPTSTLSTGYDFLAAGAQQVASSFAAANAADATVTDPRNDTLITRQGVDRTLTTVDGRPSPDRTWTAADLKAELLGSRHDVVYLAGHFSSSSALAADFSSVVTTADLAAAPAGTFAHTLVFSAGCHSGYNLVDGDAVAGLSDPLDWAQAFARQGATLVAGTGYQYGDTDFVKYSNQLYAGFAEALRRGSGTVAVGSALVQAKRDYLAGQATLDGIDQKSLLQATVYGLPMQGVDFRTGRTPAPTPDSPVTATQDTAEPGATLGLQRSTLTTDPVLTAQTRTLTGTDGASVTATYLTDPGGRVESTPGTPTLPVVGVNATAPTGTVLRGLGFREGTYTDTTGVTPLTGAPATETNTVHGPFVSTVAFPSRLATPNVFDALPGGGSSGTTRVFVTPAQYVSDAPGSLTDRQRAYSHLGFTAFYSGNVATYGANQHQPAASAAPTITATTATAKGRKITFSTHVVGDPAAGVAGVWVTWTVPPGGAGSGSWQSLDLSQSRSDSTLWTGTLTLPSGVAATDLRFLAQAVNGVGLVGVDDALGAYHRVTTAAAPPAAAAVLTTGAALPGTAPSGSAVPVAVTLRTASGTALTDRPVTITAAGSSVVAVTNNRGRASATLSLTAPPGPVDVTASFAGDTRAAAATLIAGTVTVVKRPTAVAFTPGATGWTLAVRDITRPGNPVGIPARSATVVAADAAGTVLATRTLRLDALGTGTVTAADLPAGTRTLTGWFGAAATPVVGGGVVDLTDPLYAAAAPVTLDLRPSALTLTPSRPTSAAGAPVTFTVTATTGGSSADVTDAATFTVTRTGGAAAPEVTCTGATCSTTRAGTYVVAVTYSGATTKTTWSVTPAETASLKLTPATATIAAGGSQGYVVRAYDRYGNQRATAPATLSISPTAHGSGDGASCSATACTAAVSGTYRVTATRDGVSRTAVLTVVGTPTAVLAYAGSGQQTPVATPFAGSLTAFVSDTDGNPVAGVPVRFDVVTADGGGTATFPGGATSATVSTGTDGLAVAPQPTGRTPGPLTVTATVAGVSTPASFDLTVTAADGARADLDVAVSLAPQSDGTVLATVTVRNDGPDAARQVKAALTLTGAGVISDPGAARQTTPRQVRQSLGTLAAGQQVSFTVTLTRTRTDRSLLAVASVLSATTDSDMDDNVASALLPAVR